MLVCPENSKVEGTVKGVDDDVIVLDAPSGDKKLPAKDPAKRKPTYLAAKNMFRRVLNNLTTIIEERKTDKKCIEKKEKQKEMKKIISKLEEVNDDDDKDVHLIWAVTSGGADLF